MRTNPRPTLDTISFYYPENYGPYHGTKVKIGVNEASSRPLWKHIVRRVFQFNTYRLPVMKPGLMLEIGCASGAFMHQMAKEGWDVEGVEFSQSASKNARDLGYSIYTGPLETTPIPKTAYDLIVGWMVLEHLHDPILALRKLNYSIKPNGWLVVSVPNAGALEFRLFKEAWYGLQLPTHLYHYTPKTLRVMLERSGWKVEKIYHQRILYNLFPSVGYLLADLGLKNSFTNKLIEFPKKGWIKHYFLYPVGYVLGATGQTGRMTVWARKAND
jgi:2-polyprenyl-3-methyl-5-hydroxy-6-metoxy-1,4-benzoquinol methylase